MKKFLHYLLLSGLLMSANLPMSAQTADWKVTPRYSALSPIAPGLYQFKESGKSGVIDSNGKVIVAAFDCISPFYEGLALLYDRKAEGLVLRGVLEENGALTLAEDKYIINPDYPFFSEGYLTVSDGYGKHGYLTADCRPAFRFISEEVRPFSEGSAAVGDGDDFGMLSPSGEKNYIQLPNGDYAFGGTNYYNGKCLVWDDEHHVYILDDSGQFESLGYEDLSQVNVDYLYRFGSGKGSTPDYSTFSPTEDTTWLPTQRGGKWTFRNDYGNLLTPYRYDNVGKFSSGVAIASLDGHFGLLEIVEDKSTFATWSSKSKYDFIPGSDVKCEFTLSVPEKWRSLGLSVEVRDRVSEAHIPCQQKGNIFTFKYTPSEDTSSETRDFTINVSHSGSLLWIGKQTYEFVRQQTQQQARLQASIRVNNSNANSNDLCLVTAVIRNPGSEPVTTTVRLTGGGSKASFTGKTVTITIPANGTRVVTGAFTVKKVELNGWCAVSTGHGASARRSNIQLKPF